MTERSACKRCKCVQSPFWNGWRYQRAIADGDESKHCTRNDICWSEVNDAFPEWNPVQERTLCIMKSLRYIGHPRTHLVCDCATHCRAQRSQFLKLFITTETGWMCVLTAIFTCVGEVIGRCVHESTAWNDVVSFLKLNLKMFNSRAETINILSQ